MNRWMLAAGVAALLGCAGAPTASAATKTVDVGGHGFKGAPQNLQALAFLRGTVSVHVGDTVKFRIKGGLIHTVTFVPSGQRAPRFDALDSAHPLAGVTGADGVPFWFNGQPRPITNPVAAFPTAGRAVTGGAYVNSGVPPDAARGATFPVKFPRAGTFKFICLVHPGMAGYVKVLARAAKIPTAAQDAAAAKRELATIVRQATAKAKAPTGAGRVDVGRTGPAFTINAMFPATTTVKAGASVTFTLAGQSRYEIHTVTLGPPSVTTAIENSFVTPIPNPMGPPTLAINPLAAFPSDPPPTVPPYTGTNHGNGFLTGGIMDNDPSTPPPSSTTVTFATPGTYHYECVVHAQMDGTIVVTA